jgi:hypothetical protein
VTLSLREFLYFSNPGIPTDELDPQPRPSRRSTSTLLRQVHHLLLGKHSNPLYRNANPVRLVPVPSPTISTM